MLVPNEELQAQSPTMMYELCSRDGLPTQRSLSPFMGQRNWVVQASKEKKLKTDAPLLKFIREHYDISLDKKRFNLNDLEAKSSWCDEWSPHSTIGPIYPRRLEDFEQTPELMRVFLGWMKYDIANHNSGGVKEENAENRSEATYEDKEDGELLDETDTLVFDKEPDFDADEALQKIPYLLKRLHERSKDWKIHLISLVIAYSKAQFVRSLAHSMQKSTKDLKRSDCLREGVLQVDKNGNIKGRLQERPGEEYNDRLDWIIYGSDEYREDAQQLMDCCRVLNIDIKKEDPYDYTNEAIESLDISYITSNSRYVARRKSSYIADIDDALKSMPLEVVDMQTSAIDYEELFISSIENSIRIFETCEKASVAWEAYTENKEDILACIEAETRHMFNMLNLLSGCKVYDLDSLVVDNGFLCRQDGEYVVVPVGSFADQGMRQHAESKAIIHCSGALVEITKDVTVHFITPTEAAKAAVESFQKAAQEASGIGYISYRWESVSL